MYFDFEDFRPDTPRIDPPISKREGVLLSIIFHALVALALVLMPPLGREARLTAIKQAEELARARRPQSQQDRPFVFVQPRADLEASRARERSELSDKNRIARAPDRALEPRNALPLSKGNSAERVEADTSAARPQPVPEKSPETPTEQAREAGLPERREGTAADKQPLSVLPEGRSGPRLSTEAARSTPGGSLAEALRNLQRYVDRETFNNPQGGGGDIGSSIQFDTKGVEFGPWIRRFVAQVKRNWIVPYAVIGMHGHVVMTFYVHKSGAITDLRVEQPSPIDGFNNASHNALASSNPTYPLPPEYPADRAFFTVTFFYNEIPPQ